jgi:hypothetical protein
MRSRSQPDAFAGFHNKPKRKLADFSQPRQQHFNPTTAKPNKKHQDGRQIKFCIIQKVIKKTSAAAFQQDNNPQQQFNSNNATQKVSLEQHVKHGNAAARRASRPT